MPDRRFPVLAVATHPVPYGAPFFRRMASGQQLDFHVAYGSLRRAEPGHEPFAAVVDQAMYCGCPAVASDRVGGARDLLAPVCPEFVFPCGAADTLVALLENAAAGRSYLQALGERGVARRPTRSAEGNITATIDAIQSAGARRP